MTSEEKEQEEEYRKLSLKDLAKLAAEKEINISHCLEKDDVITTILGWEATMTSEEKEQAKRRRTKPKEEKTEKQTWHEFKVKQMEDIHKGQAGATEEEDTGVLRQRMLDLEKRKILQVQEPFTTCIKRKIR